MRKAGTYAKIAARADNPHEDISLRGGRDGSPGAGVRPPGFRYRGSQRGPGKAVVRGILRPDFAVGSARTHHLDKQASAAGSSHVDLQASGAAKQLGDAARLSPRQRVGIGQKSIVDRRGDRSWGTSRASGSALPNITLRAEWSCRARRSGRAHGTGLSLQSSWSRRPSGAGGADGTRISFRSGRAARSSDPGWTRRAYRTNAANGAQIGRTINRNQSVTPLDLTFCRLLAGLGNGAGKIATTRRTGNRKRSGHVGLGSGRDGNQHKETNKCFNYGTHKNPAFYAAAE